jgi:hypothetical protein
MADDAEQVSTVEWGAIPSERQPSWMDRLAAGSVAVPPEPPAPRFRPNYLALGLAVAGFLVAAAAQYMPWIHLNGGLDRTAGGAAGGADLHVTSLPPGGAILYGFSLVIGLGLLGLLLFVETPRRLVAAATIGVLAGNALALIELSTSLEAVTGQFTSADSSQLGSMTSGFYLGLASLVLLVGAAFMAALPRRPRRTTENEDIEEPMELTVTGLGGDIG